MSEKSKNAVMKKVIITAAITVFLDILIIFLGELESVKINLGWAVACVGIITFFGMLILTSFVHSSGDYLSKTGIRQAITASFLAIYFSFVALLSFDNPDIQHLELIQPVISHFTYLVGLVVVFYFTSSSVSEYLNLKGNKKNDNPNVEPGDK